MSEFSLWFPSWQELVIKAARALVVAVTFELFAYLAARRLEWHLRETLVADSHRDPVLRSRRRSRLRGFVRLLSRVFFYPVAFLVMLDIFGIQPYALGASFLAVAALVIVGGRDWLADLASGVVILAEDQFAIGDEISLGPVTGVVERMSLRSTWVRDLATGQIHVIANRTINAAARNSPPAS